jgi:hypothetical protein
VSCPAPMELRPIDKTSARQFVTAHHRHNEAPSVAQVTFVVGLYVEDELVGVVTAGQPIARALCDGFTLEVNRTCVEGFVENANSKLYGAICRAAKALGYRKVITYTLQEESGASLRAAGFVRHEMDRSWRSWQDKTVARPRYDYNLFGERNNAAGRAKYRWERDLVRAASEEPS